ncbi:hypothetical protein PRIC2_012231 [Phytophthora ramorum]
MEKPNAVSKTNLADAERQQVLAALLIRSTNGRLKHGDIAVAETEGIHPSTISRIWTRAKTEEARTGRFASPSRDFAAGAGRPTTRQRSSGFKVSMSWNTQLFARSQLRLGRASAPNPC